MKLFAERVISRPSHEVAEFFFDAANHPTWQEGMRRCERMDPAPIRSAPCTSRRRGSWAVESIAETTCRVTARISGGPGGAFKLVAPVIRRLAQRSVDADYDRLVAHFSA